MELFFEILKAIVSGVFTALTLAGLLWLVNWVKNKGLQSKLTETIQCKSTAQSIANSLKISNFDSSGLTIFNPFNFDFTVRSVWAEYGNEKSRGRMPLRYAGIDYQDDIIPIRVPPRNPYEFIKLQAFTNGQWFLDKENEGTGKYINNLSIHVEYTTFLKSPKVIKVQISNCEIIDRINQMIDQNKPIEKSA